LTIAPALAFEAPRRGAK